MVQDRCIVSGSHMCSIEWWHCRWPWVTCNPQTTPISTFCVAFHIYVVGEHRDIKFGVQVHYSKSKPTDDKWSLKGAWSCHVTHFKYLVPLKYHWNGLSYRVEILYTGCPCEVLAFGLTNSPKVGMVMGMVKWLLLILGNNQLLLWPIERHNCKWPWVRLKVTFAVLNLFNTHNSEI